MKVPRLFKNKLPLHFFQLESPIQIKCPQKMVVSWHTVNQFLHLSWHIPVAKNHQDTIGTGIQYPDPSARTSSEGMLLSLAIQKKPTWLRFEFQFDGDNLPFRERSHIPTGEKERHFFRNNFGSDMLVLIMVSQSYSVLRIYSKNEQTNVILGAVRW